MKNLAIVRLAAGGKGALSDNCTAALRRANSTTLLTKTQNLPRTWGAARTKTENRWEERGTRQGHSKIPSRQREKRFAADLGTTISKKLNLSTLVSGLVRSRFRIWDFMSATACPGGFRFQMNEADANMAREQNLGSVANDSLYRSFLKSRTAPFPN